MQIVGSPSMRRSAAVTTAAASGSRRARSLATRLLLVLACVLSAAPARGQASFEMDSTRAAGEVTLEQRLLAPCCWNQTLDMHESDLASSLRREVRARLHAGELASTIEDDMIARYGERIRAVDKGHDPGGAMPFVVGLGALSIGALLVVMLRRWRRSAASSRSRDDVRETGSKGVQPPDDPYEARLDDELRALGE